MQQNSMVVTFLVKKKKGVQRITHIAGERGETCYAMFVCDVNFERMNKMNYLCEATFVLGDLVFFFFSDDTFFPFINVSEKLVIGEQKKYL